MVNEQMRILIKHHVGTCNCNYGNKRDFHSNFTNIEINYKSGSHVHCEKMELSKQINYRSCDPILALSFLTTIPVIVYV